MRSRSLLLLELDPQVAGALELFLRGRGYKVHAAATAAEATRIALAERDIDTVLVGDIPDSMDLAGVAQQLRGIFDGRPVGIVALTSTIDDVAGVDLVVPRTAHPRAILDALRTLARRRQVTGPLPAVRVS
jgi:DNA-binding response OmpR family regulator